jgi:hypothetical protein
LRTVAGHDGGRDHRLGRGRDGDRAEREQDQKDEVRRTQRSVDELRERTGDQGAGAQPAQVGRRGDQLEPPAPGVRPVRDVQLQQVRRGGGGDHADAEAGDEPGDQQSGQGRPGQEQHRGEGFQAQRGQQHPLAAEPVREVAGEQQAGDDADRVHGEDDRHGERGEAVPLLVDRVERGGHGGERHRDPEDGGDQPEAGAVPAGAGPGRRSPGYSGNGHAFRLRRTMHQDQRRFVLVIITECDS